MNIGSVSIIMDNCSMNAPSMSMIANMMSRAARGARLSVPTHSTRPVVAPEKASTLLNVDAPRIIMNIITVTRVAPSNDLMMTSIARQR